MTLIEDETCGGCGGDLNVTLVHQEPYDVDIDTVCWSCRAKATITRWDEKQHEQEDKNATPRQPRHGDGRIYTVKPMTMKELNR